MIYKQLVVFILLTGFVLSDIEVLHEFSLSQPFSNPHWYNVGSSHMTDRVVRLTNDVKSQKGIIFNQLKFEHPYWEVNLAFRVHGKKSSLYGDGMAFWYVDEFDKGSAFGMKANFKGIGIFLDTYPNGSGGGRHKFPYITAMINDGTKYYDHDTDGNIHQLDGCTFHFRNLEKESVLMVRYYRDRLTVSYKADADSQEVNCFELDDIHLPSHYKFGMSAETGDLSDYHDVSFMHVTGINDGSISQDRSKITPRYGKEKIVSTIVTESQKKDQPMSFLIKFLLFLLALVIICIISVFAYGIHKKRQESLLKRFY